MGSTRVVTGRVRKPRPRRGVAEQPGVDLGAMRRRRAGAGPGDGDGGRGAGEPRGVRQRAALDQRDGQRTVEDVAGGGGVDGVHGEGGDAQRARRARHEHAGGAERDRARPPRRGRAGRRPCAPDRRTAAPRSASAAASCSFGVSTETAASSAPDSGRAGAGLRISRAPRRCASATAASTVGCGISSWTSTASPGSTVIVDRLDVLGAERGVGAGRDGDHVLAGVVDEDEGDPRRRVGDTPDEVGDRSPRRPGCRARGRRCHRCRARSRRRRTRRRAPPRRPGWRPCRRRSRGSRRRRRSRPARAGAAPARSCPCSCCRRPRPSPRSMPSSDVSCAAAGVEARAEYRTHRSMAGSNTTVSRTQQTVT